MKGNELLLFGVLAWAAIGMEGIAISLLRGQRTEALRHSLWLAGVLATYSAALLLVSAWQRPATVPIAADRCFRQMCFAVTGFDERSGQSAGDGSRYLRVFIRVSNRGKDTQSDSGIRAYLIDSRGNLFWPLPGLSGNPLTVPVAAGSQIVGQPIFRIPPDSTGLGLVFTHGHWQPGRLVLGDPDSIGHRPVIVPLGDRAPSAPAAGAPKLP